MIESDSVSCVSFCAWMSLIVPAMRTGRPSLSREVTAVCRNHRYSPSAQRIRCSTSKALLYVGSPMLRANTSFTRAASSGCVLAMTASMFVSIAEAEG